MPAAWPTSIDNRECPAILGTIAGDDTIMLVLHEAASHEEVRMFLSQIIPTTLNLYNYITTKNNEIKEMDSKQIDVMVADASHEVYVDKILDTIREAAKVRGTGIAERTRICGD